MPTLRSSSGASNGATASEIVFLAQNNIGSAWTATGCVMFTWGISNLAGIPFFDLRSTNIVGNDPLSIADIDMVVPHSWNSNTGGDGWALISSSNSVNTLRQTLQAGDIVRVYLAGNTSETSAKVPALGDRYGAHSFIVESNVGGVITVIDNWGDGRFIVRHNFEQIVDYYSSNGVFQAAFVSRIDPTYVAANNATYQSVSGAVFGDFSGIGATAVAGSVAISDVVISEGNSGTQIATFTVTRSGGTAAFAVNYATANNTATAGSDYVATSGTLNFAANVNTQTVQVTINGDTGVENHETFFVNLSGPTNGAIISDNQGQGTINNDDSAAAAQANLQVTNISAIGSTYVRQGDDFIFSYQVSNTGNAQAGAHFAGIMVDQLVDETHYSNWDYVGALSAGQFQQAINSISTVGLSLGQHTLYIREDYWYNGVNESNETDNVRSLTFNVTL